MAIAYEWNSNPFQDLLVNMLLNDQDISDKRMKKEINAIYIDFLENVLNDPEDSLLLDFEIKRKKGAYQVIGKNIISALWFSGIFYPNVDEIMETNEVILGDEKYRFNEDTCQLKITKLTEKELKALGNGNGKKK